MRERVHGFEIHPELWGSSERGGKGKSSFRRNASLAIDQFVDSGLGAAHYGRQVALRPASGFEFFANVIAGRENFRGFSCVHKFSGNLQCR